jgi:prolyl 4-hydroxylase
MSRADADALWRDAHAAMAGGAVERAEALFGRAAASGHPAAQFDLARMHLYGMAAAPEVAEGLAALRRSREQGYPPALYQSAVLAIGGVALPSDPALIEECIQRAAAAGHPAALRTLGVLAGVDAADPAGAANDCLEQAARRGDLLSLGLLSQRLLCRAGDREARGRGAAMRDLLRQHDPTLPAADPTITRLEPFAGGGPIEDLPALPSTALAPPLRAAVETLHASPSVQRVPALLGVEECLYLILAGAPHLQPSITIDPGGTVRRLPLRTSDEALFDPLLDDVVLLCLQRRMAGAAGLPLAHAEHLILLRYAPGQEYRPHCDYLPPSGFVPLSEGGSGQRCRTAIACLAPALRGGATSFPRLGLQVQPRAGDLLVFDNLDADGRPEPQSLHAGEPVEAGVKWIATLWLRQGRQRCV